MAYPREILNRLIWTGEGLAQVKVTYVHRGAPGNELTIDASSIRKLARSFFLTSESDIPYHRILRIEKDGRSLFDISDYGEKAGTTKGGEGV